PCATSWMLPFSRISPPMIPSMANAIPPSVARSGRAPPLPLDFDLVSEGVAALGLVSGVFAMGSAGGLFAAGGGMPIAVQYAPAEFHAPFHHLVRTLQDAQDLSVGQCNHRIGSN